MLWKCFTQYASKFGKLSSGHRTGKGQFSFQSQRKTMTRNVQTTTQLHSSHTLAKWCSKFSKQGFNSKLTENFQMDLPHSSVGKESACSAEDLDSIPGLGRTPGEGNVNPLQYSCLDNPMDREAWQATVYGFTKSQIRLRHTHTHKFHLGKCTNFEFCSKQRL